MATPYFSDDYATARGRFRAAVDRLGGRLHTLTWGLKGPHGEMLAIDIAWLGADRPRRVLLHSSGLHGVEGFAGSAIQLQLIDELPQLPEDGAVVIVHVLNPYGMAWLRRVNEHNVDLNRNFLAPDEAYVGAPSGYARLNQWLNPESPPRRDGFFTRAIALITKYGMPMLKQTIVGGQYDFPRGLFYGGARLQEGPRLYQTFLEERLDSAERVLAIDVHTGLGKSGRDTLLAASEEGSVAYQRLREMFGDHVSSFDPEASVAYAIRGGYPSLLSRALGDVQVDFITQEFGTYPAIRVLHALREENRCHHYVNVDLNHPAKQRLKEAFCRDNNPWRRAVLSRGAVLTRQAMRIVFGDY